MCNSVRATVLAVLLSASFAVAQTQLDISSCFNPLLQQKQDYWSDERLAVAKLSQISETDYEASKHDAQLAGRFKVLALSTSYSDFDERRKEYFNLNKLDINYFRQVSLASRTLDSQAYTVISQCIDKLASEQTGFRYIITVDGAKDASVQLFWHQPETGVPSIKITASPINYATTKAAPGAPARASLYPKTSWYERYPTLAGASPVFFLERTDETKTILISITTDPPVRTYPIRIPPVPKTPLDLNCHTVYDEVDPSNKQPYKLERVVMLQPSHVTGPHGCPGNTACAGFHVAMEAPGPITRATCDPIAGYMWTDSCSVEGKVVHHYGFFNSGGQGTKLTAWYKVARQQCDFPASPNVGTQ